MFIAQAIPEGVGQGDGSGGTRGRIQSAKRVFMHGLFVLFIHLLVISVQNICHNKDRKLRRNRVSVFEMFFAGDKQNFVTEFSQRFIPVRGYHDRSGISGLGGFHGRDYVICGAADTDTKDKTVGIENNRIHFHNVAVRDRLDVDTDTHKAKLHFLSSKPGASSPIDIDTLFRGKQHHNPFHLCLIDQCIAFVQKFLVSI